VTTSTTTSRANGTTSGVVDLAAPARRRVRLPELGVGVLVVVGCALVAALLYLQADRKMPVTVLAADVAAGEVIEHRDLRVAYLSADGPLEAISPEAAGDFVGRRAAHRLAAGSLLTSTAVVEGSELGAGEGVVAVAVGAAAMPARLAVGDTVNVVVSGTDVAAEAVLVRGAVVHGIEALEVEGGAVVSLRTSEEAANSIAAGEPSRLRLVLVGR
jgi:hypothetical protein